MDQSNTGPNADSDLSESWTLLEKESSEIDESTLGEGNESSNKDDVPAETEISKSISSFSDSSCGAVPLECPVTTQNEGTESLDSDGISIISESEEEELKLLPCNSTNIEDRPFSRASNIYFDETDTASQYSSGVQDVPVTPTKKYKHHPNNNLNTSLNVLLVVAWAAVIGLGMGHFLGLQEECSTGNSLDEKVKNDSQNEELSALLLKKLELENTALKEQFAHLQKMIEDLNQKNSIPCKDSLQKIVLLDVNHERAANTDEFDEPKCLVDSSNAQLEMKDRIDDRIVSFDDDNSMDSFQSANSKVENTLPLDEKISKDVPEIGSHFDFTESSSGINTVETETTSEDSLDKNDILQRLEQSLEDVAVLFNDKFNTNKLSFENSREALSGTISVLSGLVGNLKEKVMAIKDSFDGDSLNFEKPFMAITKMEEILQKTTDKVQKIKTEAFKEGKPLFTISNKVTSKLQAINKKLEEKWCQVKEHLSKQSLVWNWLDSQIFQNCNEDNEIEVSENKNENKHSAKQTLPEEQRGGEQYEDEGLAVKDKNKPPKNGKKPKDENNNAEYKNKQNVYKTDSLNMDKTKEKYKKKGWVNPHSFDAHPKKGGNAVNADYGKKKDKIGMINKNNPDLKEKRNEKGQDLRLGKNEGKYIKGVATNKSGEWVEALFNHRAERRRDERRSDWIFARARSRAKTRESTPSRWYLRKGESHT